MLFGILLTLSILILPFIITGGHSDEEFDEEMYEVNMMNDIEGDIRRGFY